MEEKIHYTFHHNMFGFGKNGKEKQARQQLSDLGLDPSLFDDPEFSDDEPEVGSDAYIESFASETIPVAKPPDVSHLLGGGGDDDSDVELDEQGHSYFYMPSSPPVLTLLSSRSRR